MIKRRRWISALALAVFIAQMLALTGCGSDEVIATQPDPPDLPPTTAFVMDFDDFAGSEALAHAPEGSGETLLAGTRENWSYAAFNVLIWNTILTIGLAVPAASFIAAVGQTPVRHINNDWVWSYNFYVNEVLHLAELHGRVEEDEVVWGMYISKQDAFEEFLWYSGVSEIDGTEGSWTIYKDPDDPTPLIRIDWHRDPDEGSADIRYTNIIPGDAENGGYIFHGVADGLTYDAFYEIYNKGKNNYTNIGWNRTTKAGRVQDEDHFLDSVWHCWDDELDDDACP